jgi:ATP phosphoribosyltransferase regulatory subunit HisZ
MPKLKETKAEQTTDTVIFHHKRITCPTVSAADAIVEAAAKLNQTIQENMKESLTTKDMNELDRLANSKRLHKKSVKMTPDNRGCPGNESMLQLRGCLPQAQGISISMTLLRG